MEFDRLENDMDSKSNHEQRWATEAAFFDAEEYSESPIDPLTIERYKRCSKPWLPAEYPYWTLGDVKGKRILEIGCGDGGNAILMALKGGHVSGIDISPRAIEIAKKKALLHGVQDRTEFQCLPFELYSAPEKFDIVIGFAILHHLLPVLEDVLRQIQNFGGPETRYIFNEPVSLARWIRGLRLMLPIPVHGTPDERPLEPPEFAILSKCFPRQMDVHYFACLLRGGFFLLKDGNYEQSNGVRQMAYDFLGRIDQLLLAKLRLGSLASSAVIEARI